MIKTKQFDKLIYEAYGVTDLFEKLGDQIKNVRETMSKYDDFKKLSAKTQFDFCCTICLIATQTSSQDLQRLKSQREEGKYLFKYSINRNQKKE